jgi:hypothetical protein
MAQVGNALNIWAPNRVNPYNLQWQFDIQRELPSKILAEIGYVGMHSLKLLQNYNLNELPDQYLAQGAAQNTQVLNPFLGVFPPTSTLGQGPTINQRQLWLAYPQFTSLTINADPTGNAIYHSLQMKAEKRLTHGLSVLTHYTFSKDFVSNTTSVVNVRHYRAISPYDQSHSFRQTFTYAFPNRIQGHGFTRRVLQEVANGWEMGGYWEYVSGLPLSVTQANGRPLRIAKVALSGPVGDRIGDKKDPTTGKVLNPYFNINAFQPLASQYVVTPEPPLLAELRAPAGRNLNVSAYKNFAVGEHVRLVLNVEFDEVLNSPIFGSPGTNMSSTGTFGVITTASGSRSGKLGLRMRF